MPTITFYTGFPLFPMVKPFYIKDDYYVIGVQTKKGQGVMSKYNPFVIMKSMSLDAWGFQLYRNNIDIKKDCFNIPFEIYVSHLNEENLISNHFNKKIVHINGNILNK